MAELLALGDPDNSYRPMTKVDACEKMEVSRSSLYDWINNHPEFVEYINHVADRGMESRVNDYYRALDDTIFNNPRGPSIKGLELVLRALGKLKGDVKIDVNMNENKSVDEKSNDELVRELEQMRRDAGLDT